MVEVALVEHTCFNPRSPCGERLMFLFHTHGRIRFQSSLPVWGATCEVEGATTISCCFNPRSPCGERLEVGDYVWAWDEVSILAPRVGSDSKYAQPCMRFAI